MIGPLLGQIHELVARRGPLTPKEAAQSLGKAGEYQEEQRLLLLMRLDPDLEPATDGRWVLRSRSMTDEERIVETARAYFNATGKKGFPTPRLVAEVVAKTGLGEPQVKQVLLAKFKNNRLNIYGELAK